MNRPARRQVRDTSAQAILPICCTFRCDASLALLFSLCVFILQARHCACCSHPLPFDVQGHRPGPLVHSKHCFQKKKNSSCSVLLKSICRHRYARRGALLVRGLTSPPRVDTQAATTRTDGTHLTRGSHASTTARSTRSSGCESPRRVTSPPSQCPRWRVWPSYGLQAVQQQHTTCSLDASFSCISVDVKLQLQILIT